MVLYLIGIGLADEKDITVKGLEIVRSCDSVYLEYYTSLLQCSVPDLEKFYQKKIIVANREMMEQGAEKIVQEALQKEVGVLIIGDPFSATTHVELYRLAKEKNVPIKIVHNASVLTAVGVTGLQLYKFGSVTSILFFEEYVTVTTPYEVLEKNMKNGSHTLLLLDLDPSLERFMTVNDALEILEKIEQHEQRGVVSPDLLVVGCARLGAEDFVIRAGRLEDVKRFDFGRPPHCLIVPGALHFMEEEVLKMQR